MKKCCLPCPCQSWLFCEVVTRLLEEECAYYEAAVTQLACDSAKAHAFSRSLVQRFYNCFSGVKGSDARIIAKNLQADLAKQIGCSEEILSEIAQAASEVALDDLKTGLEPDEDDLLSSETPESSLATLQTQKAELIQRNCLPYRQAVQQQLKFKRHNFEILDLHRKDQPPGPKANFIPQDVILTVLLMKPYNRPLYQHEIRLGRLMKMDAAFLVRGKECLTDLKDDIQCLSDFAYSTDHSRDPSQIDQTPASKDLYPSSFFFIHDTFYNDRRKSEAEDLSLPIREWAKKRPKDVGPLKVKDMAKTKFMDLDIKLGQPYLYLHQGSCEHLLIFSDLRLIHSDDSPHLRDYPLLISSKMKKRVPCSACKVYTAKWVVSKNMHLSFHPGFFCEACFMSFHYDEHGEKQMDFEAVPYFDRNALN